MEAKILYQNQSQDGAREYEDYLRQTTLVITPENIKKHFKRRQNGKSIRDVSSNITADDGVDGSTIAISRI